MKSQVHLLRSNHICTKCGEGFVTPKTLQDHVANTCTGFNKSFDNGDGLEHALPEGMEEEEDGEEEIEEEEEEEEMGMDLRRGWYR